MKVLVLGSGGREHALAWRLSRSESVREVVLLPGNGGTDLLGWNLERGEGDEVDQLAALEPDLVLIGPEAPLVDGLADRLRERGLAVFGPGRRGAALEGSKAYAKEFMLAAGIPTAFSRQVESVSELKAALGEMGEAVVLKADGLAAGKGVLLPESREEALRAGEAMLSGDSFGEAGRSLLVEERLEGYEISLLAVLDGKDYFLLPSSQDHKRALDGDLGPNTGGMGAYGPVPGLGRRELDDLGEAVFGRALAQLHAEGIDYRGVLYAGLMMTAEGPRVLEFNVRFGDPETQVLMMLLGGDFGRLLASAAAGRLDTGAASLREGAAMVVVLASAGYPGAVDTGHEITGLGGDEDGDLQVFHAGTRREGDRLLNSGGRVLGVTAWGPDLALAARRCYGRAESIHFEGMSLRRDIGWRALAAC